MQIILNHVFTGPATKTGIMDEDQKFLNISETSVGENFSIDVELFDKYHQNRAIPDTAYWSLIVSYSMLIIAGSLGNLLVIVAVVNNKSENNFSG